MIWFSASGAADTMRSPGIWSNRSMSTSPNRDSASKIASSVSSSLSSSASKATSAASAAADAPTSELVRAVASEVRSLVQGELTSEIGRAHV